MSGWVLKVGVLATLTLVLGAGYASRIPAADDHASVEPGEEVLIDVLANDGALGPDLTLLRVRGGTLGTAQIDGQQVRYTAADGVSGTDQLSYTVRRANGQVAAGRIFVAVEPTVQLTLTGTIAGVAPTCDVAVVVGEERFDACTSSGTFQIDISTQDSESVIWIDASARPLDIDTEYRFASVLGSLERLLEMAEEAGTPGQLDFTQFGHLRLQEFTTMHHAQLRAEGGPGVFDSEAALAEVQKDLDAQRLFALAVTFRAARRGWVTLPPGFDDPYAAAFNLPLFESFYNSAMPAVFDQAREDLIDSEIQMPWPQHQRIGLVLGAMGAAPGNINVPFIEGRQVVLEPGGVGRAYHPQNADGSNAAWTLDPDGRVQIDEAAPARAAFTVFLICSQGEVQPFVLHQAIRFERATRVVQSSHSDVVLFDIETRIVNFDDIPPGCTTTQVELARSSVPLQTFGRDQVLPIGVDATPGRWATRLPAPTPGSLAGVNGELNAGIVDFAAGTVEAPGLSLVMQVAQNDDNGLDLVMQAADLGSAAIDMQVFRTRTDGRGGEQWLGNADGEGLGSLGMGGLSVRETHADLFSDVGQAIGSWRSSFAVVTAGRQSASPTQVFYEVAPAGVGMRRQILENGALSQWPFGWEIDATGCLVITTWYSTVTMTLQPECVDECYVFERRTWQPVSLDTDGEPKRLYMIEEIIRGNAENDELDVISRRVNFYDGAEPPDSAPVTPADPVPARARMR